jgi:hypothetical protein
MVRCNSICAIGALGVVLAGAAQAAPSSVRNAGIVWGSYDAIRSANVDGSGRRVLVPMFGDNQGDPSWTRDGRALTLFASFSDTARIYVLGPKSHRFHALFGLLARRNRPGLLTGSQSPSAKHGDRSRLPSKRGRSESSRSRRTRGRS